MGAGAQTELCHHPALGLFLTTSPQPALLLAPLDFEMDEFAETAQVSQVSAVGTE